MPSVRPSRHLPLRLLVAAALAHAVPATAQQARTPETLPEVKVSGEREETATGPAGGYAAKRSSTATKTDTPLLETPQSVTVVTRERIEELGATTLQDAVNYAAGVRPDAFGLDSRTDSAMVRGGYPDEFRDGLRGLFGYYTSTARIDPYALERIEVLRGPSAMLYGQGTTAGVVNTVSKRPLADNQREIGVQVGSYGRKQVQADLTGPLTADGKWLYRVVGIVRDSDTQVDHVPDDRRFFAPSLTWRPSEDTTLTFLGNWQQDRSGSTLQFMPWEAMQGTNPNGQVPTSRFIGEPGFDRYDTDRMELGWVLDHKIGRDWLLHQTVRWSRNDNLYNGIYPDSYSPPGDNFLDSARRVLNRFAQSEYRYNRMIAADTNLQGKLRTGPVEHTVLAGVDVVRFRETGRGAYANPPTYDGTMAPIDIYNPVYTGLDIGEYSDIPRSQMRSTGIYVQEQAKINQRWIAVAGLRHDRVTASSEGTDDNSDRATTGRAGLMFLAPGGWAPYVSYSESFTPIAGINTTTMARFKPMEGQQYEAGVKFQPQGSSFMFAAAAYDLKEKNRTIEVAPNVVLQVGETKTRGIELELAGRVLPGLDVLVNYNWIDNDDQLDTMPKNQVTAWGTYRFDAMGWRGLSVGLGIRHMEAFKDKDAPETPANTLFDGMIAFETGAWRFALNGQNLTDKIYNSVCLARGDCFYGARRTIVGTVSYRF